MKPSKNRKASWVAIAIWSSHYHEGQSSQIYRMGSRAQNLFKGRVCAGEYVLSKIWDNLEAYVSGESNAYPNGTNPEYSLAVKKAYKKLVNISEQC